MNKEIFSKMSAIMRQLMTGAKLTDIINNVFDEQMQQRIALAIHQYTEQKREHNNADHVILTVVPVAVCKHGVLQLDSFNNPIYQLRFKTVEVIQNGDQVVMGRILSDLGVPDIIQLINNNQK